MICHDKIGFGKFETYRSVDVGWRANVRVSKHRNNTQHDCGDCLRWQPSFFGQLAAHRIFARRMQNGNADFAVLIYY